MKCLLLSPISPSTVGVGLAGRVRQWQASLSRIGEVSTIVIPVAGPSRSSETVITPGPDSDDALPRLARGLTEAWGRRYRIHAHDADVIVAVRSYLGHFALGLAEATNAPVIVDLDDDDADYFRQRGESAEAERFEHLVNSLRERHVQFVSATGFAGTTRIPNTVPVPELSTRQPAMPPRCLVVGNFTYEPNAEGAIWFIEQVLPRVLQSVPEFELRLIGPGSERVSPHGVGVVADLAEEYAQASLTACPILMGSGTRTKIIEAWMHRVPVVSTGRGADGLDAGHSEHLLIGDSPEEFANHILRLLSESDLVQRLTTSARHHADTFFSPQVVASAMTAVVEPLVRDRARSYVMARNLHLTETDDGMVVLDRSNDSVHTLNTTASMVLVLADGTLDETGIAEEIRTVLGLEDAPITYVQEALQQLCKSGLVSARIQ